MKKLLQLDQVSIKNRPKSDQHKLLQLDQNSIKNRHKSDQHKPKIGQKSGQNRSKIGSGRSQKQQRTHKHPRAHLYFWPKCRQHGRNLAPQTSQNREKNRSKNRSNFELLLGSSLDAKIVPKTTPKSIKHRAKIDLKSEQAKKWKMLKKNYRFLYILNKWRFAFRGFYNWRGCSNPWACWRCQRCFR